MPDPSREKIGNVSDEMGEHESGRTFEGLNRSAAPEAIPHLDVDVSQENGNLRLIPRLENTGSLAQTIGTVQEGPLEQLNAMIFEDPAMNSRLSGAIERKAERGQLIFYGITPRMTSACFGDRVMVFRDTMESAYSCRYCKGKGHTDEVCATCKGNKVGIDTKESGCRSCKVLGYEKEIWRSSGFVKCAPCNGVGHPAGLVIPDSAKSAPVSGVIVSIGPQCKNLQLGDRVLVSRYAGHTLDTPDGETFITMHESEVLQLLKEL